MSLVKTLAKVAVGVAVAKGASSLMKGGSGGGLLGGSGSSGGGLAGMLGGALGGGSGAGTGGLGGLMGAMSGTGGGDHLKQLGEMLSGSGSGGASGGLGGILDSLGGAGALAGVAGAGGLGALLNSALTKGADEPDAAPSAEQEEQAALLLRAMIQAAKCDGRIDESEQAALTQHLGDVSAEEEALVRAELARPVDVDALARDTPRGMEEQVYAISLVGLDIDSQAEADYMDSLGQALRISTDTANAIHEKMGEPILYR